MKAKTLFRLNALLLLFLLMALPGLNGERVNLKANEGQKEPNLAISSDFPVSQATAEEGRLRFNLQVEGLAKLVQDRLKRLF